MRETTYSQARANLASLCDDVTENNEMVIIHRRGAKSVALIAAEELAGLMETAHLMRSPANADRLRSALARAQRGEKTPETIDSLRSEAGLG